jgi:SAM-dependent methyltransferase
MTDYNEGLGVVYERFVINDLLERLRRVYEIHTVLEVPIYGMAGVSGINSVVLAQRGCSVTLVDTNPERLQEVTRVWAEIGLAPSVVQGEDLTRLPFADRSFDLVWNHAALWHVGDQADGLLREMARVSRKLVLVAMPNRWQVGYLTRKYVVDREFFRQADERWADMGRIARILRGAGVHIVEQGVLDIPPWPDTVMPAAEFLRRLGVSSRRVQSRFEGERWTWSTMDYYRGKDPSLRSRVMRYTWLEHLPLPWQVKAVWAHHRYLVGQIGSGGAS